MKYLKLVHDTCSYMLSIIMYSTTRILSTPSNKMAPKYYFTFLEPIPIKSESAAFFTLVALGGHALGGLQMSVWETLCWEVIYHGLSHSQLLDLASSSAHCSWEDVCHTVLGQSMWQQFGGGRGDRRDGAHQPATGYSSAGLHSLQPASLLYSACSFIVGVFWGSTVYLC